MSEISAELFALKGIGAFRFSAALFEWFGSPHRMVNWAESGDQSWFADLQGSG